MQKEMNVNYLCTESYISMLFKKNKYASQAGLGNKKKIDLKEIENLR